MSMELSAVLSREVLAGDAARFGTKFAVQRMFCELGMCSVPTLLFEPHTALDQIAAALDGFGEEHGVTVRFSYRNNLNLPRGFFQDHKQALAFIERERKDFALILQQYTQLVTSFELYSDADHQLYLQVMPGIWEVDTEEPPDIVQSQDSQLTIWRYTQARTAKVAQPGGTFTHIRQEPHTFEQLRQFHQQLVPYMPTLLAMRQVFDPLFCHFYEDVHGRLSFINIRHVGRVPINHDSPNLFHLVRLPVDVDAWDGSRPILFDVQSSRDDDSPIVAAIRRLRRQGIERVFVNYGILSHPAILLREAGVEVHQAYTYYERRQFDLDARNVPDFAIHAFPPVAPRPGGLEVVPLSGSTSTQPNQYTMPLQQITQSERGLVGSKACNLARLIHAGFPVPPGFVVTTLAHKHWSATFGDSASDELPPDVVRAILGRYRELEQAVVAVRSSACSEDLEQASSAGLYKTSLSVVGDTVLLSAVIAGFRSFSASAPLLYREAEKLSDAEGMAILVQVMVPAEAAGVLFTQDPQNPGSGSAVINATFGLGDALVAGRIAGDLYYANESGAVVQAIIGDKPFASSLHGDISLGEQDRGRRVLTSDQITLLVQTGKAIEALWGVPQDIEFAFEGGELWILQSRPITQSPGFREKSSIPRASS